MSNRIKANQAKKQIKKQQPKTATKPTQKIEQKKVVKKPKVTITNNNDITTVITEPVQGNIIEISNQPINLNVIQSKESTKVQDMEPMKVEETILEQPKSIEIGSIQTTVIETPYEETCVKEESIGYQVDCKFEDCECKPKVSLFKKIALKIKSLFQ